MRWLLKRFMVCETIVARTKSARSDNGLRALVVICWPYFESLYCYRYKASSFSATAGKRS